MQTPQFYSHALILFCQHVEVEEFSQMIQQAPFVLCSHWLQQCVSHFAPEEDSTWDCQSSQTRNKFRFAKVQFWITDRIFLKQKLDQRINICVHYIRCIWVTKFTCWIKNKIYLILPITLEVTYLHQCWTVHFGLIIMIQFKHYLPYPFIRRRALASNIFWPSCTFVTVLKVAKAYLWGNRFQLYGHEDSSLSSWTPFRDIKKIKLLYKIIVKKGLWRRIRSFCRLYLYHSLWKLLVLPLNFSREKDSIFFLATCFSL